MKYQIAWLNRRPYLWCASTDGGKTWLPLVADDPNDSSEPVEEASAIYGVLTSQWQVMDDAIVSLGA